MFDFLFRKQIDSILERAYGSAMETYRNSLIQFLGGHNYDDLTEDMLTQKADLFREAALQEVSNFVYGVVRAAPPNVFSRYRLAKMNPNICGAPEETGYCAGVEYCFLHYAFTAKPGGGKNAIKHNHIFAAYIDSVLAEIDFLTQLD